MVAVRMHPRHDAVRPAVQVAGHILDRFALADRSDAGDGVAAQLLDGELEGQPRAQRRFLEQQGKIAGGKRSGEFFGRSLHFLCEIQNRPQRFGREVVIGSHVLRKPLGR